MVTNAVFGFIIKNQIFQLSEEIMKKILIASVFIVFIINITFVLSINNKILEKIKYIEMVIVLTYLNSTFIDKFINWLPIIIFEFGYVILKNIINFNTKLKF